MYQSNCSCLQDAVNKVNCSRRQCCCGGTSMIIGPTGPTGPAGPVTVQVGTTTTTAPGTQASVTNVGTSENVILNFAIPAGATGPTGPAPELEIGSVTTGLPGSQASVTITEV